MVTKSNYNLQNIQNMSLPNKFKLINDVQTTFTEFTEWYRRREDNDLNRIVKEGKWSAAGHLYHVVKTTNAINMGMQLPKGILESQFGKCKRVERNFSEQHNYYLETLAAIVNSGKTVTPPSNVVPDASRIFEKERLMQRLKKAGDDYYAYLEIWEEEDLGTYVIPHPLMGKLTLREFAYFTIFHTKHHHDNLKENYTFV